MWVIFNLSEQQTDGNNQMKNIINHHKLSDLLRDMTEVQALNTLSRMRTQADREGLCVTRLIVEGKVVEQWIWKH